MSRIRLGIIFGGRSKEHEISLISSKSVSDHLCDKKYEKVFIGISKEGIWCLYDEDYLENPEDPGRIKLKASKNRLSLIPSKDKLFLYDLYEKAELSPIDIALPILHGPYGEDGRIQGLLDMMDVPYIGCGVLSSSICMDKIIAKKLLCQADIKNSKFLYFRENEKDKINYDDVKDILSMPVFVKPANLGSSVGITKVHDKDELNDAVDNAFLHDSQILIEEAIIGREIECSVLENKDRTLIASIPGEVIPKDIFYSYKAKYLDENGAILKVPAELDEPIIKKIQIMAKKAFSVLNCQGMARVDFFLKDDGSVYVNEINTIPGFTKISMYPKLFEYSGIPYSELLDRLIELALFRFNFIKK